MSLFATDGLSIAASAIRHIAGTDPSDPLLYNELPAGPAENMAIWAPIVRASLYLTDTLKSLDWQQIKTGNGVHVVVKYRNKPLATLHRPEADMFRRQLKHLRSYADQRADRSSEILSQLGFPTDYFASIMGLNGDAHRSTLELIAITQVIASHVVLTTKHYVPSLRPDRRGAAVMPMIQTPAHSSFPSGHATEAFAVATVLAGLVKSLDALPSQKRPYPSADRLIKLLHKQAERIAVNRTVAGVHFPIDSWAGAALGEAVGQLILARCLRGVVTPRTYIAKDSDFLLADFNPVITGGAGDPARHGLVRDPNAQFPVARSAMFGWLWNKAIDEHSL